MKKKPVNDNRPKKVISTWHLPNSGERIALQVVRDTDGFDRPSFDFGGLSWEDFSEKYVGPLEDDQEFFHKVIWPQAKDTMKEYFYRRARFDSSIAKVRGEADRLRKKSPKASKPRKATH